MKEERPVIEKIHEHVRKTTNADDPIIRRVNIGDTNYALLGALYRLYRGAGQGPAGTAEVKEEARRLTNLPINYDYRSRTQGIWYVSKK